MPPPDHSVRLRDGDREIEVRGNPAFVRQVLDDLPSLMARLRGDAPGRTTISMPAPPAAALPEAPPVAAVVAEVVRSDVSAGNGSGALPVTDHSLEDRVLDVLRASNRPLPIAAIRHRLDDEVTGQQVRRLLEKAGSRVTVSQDRPATYSLS
jgi:hypothetical protein